MNLEFKVLKLKGSIAGTKQEAYRCLNILGILNDEQTEKLCTKNVMSLSRAVQRYCLLHNIDYEEHLKHVANISKELSKR